MFENAIKNVNKEINEIESSAAIKNEDKYQILELLADDLKLNINDSIDSSLKLFKLNSDSNKNQHHSSSSSFNWKDLYLDNFSKLLDQISNFS